MILDLQEKVKTVLEPILQHWSAELVELEIRRYAQTINIQVLADRPSGGITIEECTGINRDLGEKIEEENFILGHYVLDVSSPGLDRPLMTMKDFYRVIGRQVRFHLLEPIENKLEHTGLVKEVKEDGVIIQSKLNMITIPFQIISKALQVI